MFPPIHPRIRIALVLVLSFLVSGFIMKYTQNPLQPTSSSKEIAPYIAVNTIVSDFSHSDSDAQSQLKSSLQSIRLPPFISFETPFENSSANPETTPTNEPSGAPQSDPNMGWDTAPTSLPGRPTSTPAVLRPITNPTTSATVPTTKLSPTSIPATSVPQPTKVPKPTPTPTIPPVTSAVRPGTTIQGILQDVAQRMCIPFALLMAERTEESGVWFNNMSASTVKMVNTYGWWTSASQSQICSYLAYSTQSGLIPADSGGGSCGGGVQPGAYDQQIMGLFQVGEAEQTGAMKYIKPVISGNVDRRVLFDNAVIFAIITKGRAGNSAPASCTDWPESTVKLIAQKHFGACAYPGGNYCTEVWNLYKSFK